MVKRYTVTLSDKQDEMISSLEEMGNTQAERIRNIVIAWLSEKSFMSSSGKKRLDI